MTRQELIAVFECDALPLVKRIASAFARRSGLPVDDLIQEGSIAAWRKLGNYSPSLGYSLSTFLGRRILGAIQDYAREHSHLMGTFRGHLKAMPRVISIEMLATDQVQFEPEDYRAAAVPDGDRENAVAFNRQLFNLSPHQAQAVRLHYLQGLAQREVASRMRLSESRISQLLHQAVDILRRNHGAAALGRMERIA